MFKREILKKKYEELEGCTLLINPISELREAYLNMNSDMDSLTKLFEKYQLPNKSHEFNSTALSIYTPEFHENGKSYIMIECFAVTIDCNILREDGITQKQFGNIIDTVVEKLSVEVLEYIQFNLTPVHICKILGIDEYVKGYGEFSLKDFIKIAAQGSQKRLCEKLEISESFLSGVVNGKQDISINIIKKIHKLYPLFPIEIFLKS